MLEEYNERVRGILWRVTECINRPIRSNFVVVRPQITKKTTRGLGGAARPPAGPGKSLGGGSGGKAPKSSENFVF